MIVVDELLRTKTIKLYCSHCGEPLNYEVADDNESICIIGCLDCARTIEDEAYKRGWDNAIQEPVIRPGIY
jgi:hypothetical protein